MAIKLKVGKTYLVSDPESCKEAGNGDTDTIVSYDSKARKFIGKEGDKYHKNGKYNDRKMEFRALDLVREVNH